jgi:hypothetical protein
MTDLEQAERELNEAVYILVAIVAREDSLRRGGALEYYAEKRRAYGAACHTIKCDLCRSVRHADECWERKLILGEV